MKKIKVISCVVAVLFLLAIAVACAQAPAQEDPGAQPTQSAAAEKPSAEQSAAVEQSAAAAGEDGKMVDTTAFKKDGPYVIGFSNISVVNTWRQQAVRELEEHAADLGVEIVQTDAGGDQAKQISDIQDLTTRGIDALIVMSGSSSALNSVLKQVIASGIPVITTDSEVDDLDSFTCHVGANSEDYGYTIAKWLLNEIDGKGKIIVLNGMAGNATSTLRENGLKRAMEELPDGGENIEILATYSADWAYDKGKQSAEQALAAYPEIDGIWSQGGAMSQGAIEAFQAAGRDLVPITGEDNNGYLKMWKSLQDTGFTSVATSFPTYMTATALDTALSILKGESVPKYNYLPAPTITDDNLDEYARPEYSDAYWCVTGLSKEQAEKYYLED